MNLTLMAGGGIDGNPVPDESLSFDVPDSDAWFASLGFRYDIMRNCLSAPRTFMPIKKTEQPQMIQGL